VSVDYLNHVDRRWLAGRVDLSFHLYHVKLLLSGAKITIEADRPCSESLDGTLENKDLHIIVSAFYFAGLDGSIFFMRLEQKSHLYDFFLSRDMARGEQFFIVVVMVWPLSCILVI
jgi:hypothetical protein